MAPAHFLLPAVGALPAHSVRGRPVAPVRFDSAARSRNRFHVLDTEGRDEGDAAAAAEAPWARPHAADEQPQNHHPAPPQEVPGVVEPAPAPAPAPAPGSATASAGFLRLVAGTGAVLFFASSAIAARPLFARVVFRALGTAGEPALAQVLADADRDLLAAWLRGRHSRLVFVAAGAALWALRVPGVANFFHAAEADAAQQAVAEPAAWIRRPRAALLLLVFVLLAWAGAEHGRT
ncbi:hypothetical protein ACP70R_032572 [Stipagrostis hirtigluma subsp. patula]